MDEEEKQAEESKQNQTVYYLIGAILLVVLAAAGYFLLRPKGESVLPTLAPVLPTPTPGPITGLACESQYYNPANFLPEYNLGVEGVDLVSAKTIDCVFNVSVAGQSVATDSATGELTAAPQRNGLTFRCTTKRLKLDADVPTKVDVTVKDDLGVTTSCTQTFTLPKP